jgi:hypothetical protein
MTQIFHPNIAKRMGLHKFFILKFNNQQFFYPKCPDAVLTEIFACIQMNFDLDFSLEQHAIMPG